MSINRKFTLGLIVLVFALITLAAVWIVSIETSLANSAATRAAAEKSAQALNMLTITNTIMSERVQSSMNVLVKRGKSLGTPSLGAITEVADRKAPELYLGDDEQSNNYRLVDDLTSDMGGTATLFAYDGRDYIRVSTNVKKQGKRATGTILNPEGAAFKSIENGSAFYGQVDILGSPYLTGYAPMHNLSGDTIGIWYVGYSADLSSLNQQVASARILEQGFVAILDNKGRLRFHSDNHSKSDIESILAAPNAWNLKQTEFTPWGYTIVTAYSKNEVASVARNVSAKVAAAVALSGLLVIGLVLALLKVFVTRPMQHLINAIKSITEGNGDLTVRLDSAGKDEFGVVANEFDQLMEKFQNTIRAITDSSGQLLDSADSLTQIAKDSKASVEQQYQGIDSVGEAMLQMSLAAQNIAKSTSDADQLAKTASLQANSGQDSLHHTIEIVQQLTQSTQQCADTINQLGEHSLNIAGVLDVINSIAEQTNLLALNAAIEAARAGEHGRGFAVVSDEVRLLATRTQNSIGDIREQIEKLQSGAQEATRTMAENRNITTHLAEKATESGQAIGESMKSVRNISALNTEIASASEEQSHVSDEINQNVENVKQLALQSSEQTEATRRAGDALMNLAERLKEQLSLYRA
ncbi:methyl-accepting chemotaxis protein [Gilvimarinus agarilyticus]|uniref:methyl-accepting chemotaxis protein n=1 Tax=Gilvimarinus sp. 2_MG-2023 TaxID=3062666 RepID=UPI001C0A504A|nr:methyl-accepting chemotaxis protein [Gilvimarinus sp. 2_MG-2023]MBU2887448.1 methyl-accepting chemotaxis protein [Gilvimarinus agarilyticus]MDO6572107.1 methyl-accepting chemotaxis protein [Gilvimarinus sp. 2_MG-2023]